MARSFESLTPQEVLSLAIEIERRNSSSYRALARIFAERNRELGILFKELCEEELDHMDQLEALWTLRFGDQPKPRVLPADVAAEIERVGPEPLDLTALRELDEQKALAYAHAAEQAAADFYARASAATEDIGLKALFTSLALIEKGHVQQVLPAASSESMP